ncbi:FUSC family protein [Streptomyces sp. TS71-3]|uniref:FUSC family protein n=1 Tax=Streptomyces sp. TS71-3 TaxID=2733862 RepID=UPI001BB3901D|nr:FUSC family protein [Streptomyces sp. TS71-3]
MSWIRALKETGRSGLAIERKRLEPLVAARGALGLAIVIAFSQWAFGPAVAAGSAFGAFQAAIATFQGSWRPRPELAFASGTSLGISTFLGYLTVTHRPAFLALLVVWTFLAGLSWAAGPTVGFIASTNVAIMLVTVTLPTSVAQAAAHGGVMVLGGLVQAALVVLLPLGRWGAHRDALAGALASEAEYARELRDDPQAPFDPKPLMQARDAAALTPRQARTRPAELHGARGLAERIRPVLAALADPAVGAAESGRQRERVHELLTAAGAILDAVADAIRHGRRAELPPNAVAAFATPDTGTILTGPARRAAVRLSTLLHDLAEAAGGVRGHNGLPVRGRSAAEHGAGGRAGVEAGTGDHASRRRGRQEAGDRLLRRPGLVGLVPEAVRAMRREARHGSQIRRHALRAAAVVAAGYLLGSALPLGHGYWAPMAAVMVMRPDFSGTYSRAVARFAGTLVGVVLATAVVRLAAPGTPLAGTLAVVSAGLMYLLMRTGQLASQACIGAYVVFLLGMGGEEWTQTVPQRVLLTLLGGVLAMLAYAVYPDWETPRLRGRLADWLGTNLRYSAEVVGRYGNPAGHGSAEVRTALLTARDARIEWREAAERAGTEPVRARGLSRTAADAAARAVGQLGRVTLLMEAHAPARDADPWPAAERLADALGKAAEKGAKAVREGHVPHWDGVRAALETAGEDGDGGHPGAGDASGGDAGAGDASGADTGAGSTEEAGAGERPLDGIVLSSGRLLLDALDELSDALRAGSDARLPMKGARLP